MKMESLPWTSLGPGASRTVPIWIYNDVAFRTRRSLLLSSKGCDDLLKVDAWANQLIKACIMHFVIGVTGSKVSWARIISQFGRGLSHMGCDVRSDPFVLRTSIANNKYLFEFCAMKHVQCLIIVMVDISCVESPRKVIDHPAMASKMLIQVIQKTGAIHQ